MGERVKPKIPSMACKNLSPLLAPSLSVPSLEFPSVPWQHHHEALAPVPLLMLSLCQRLYSPFCPLMNKSRVHSGTSPPKRLPWFPHHLPALYCLCTYPPPISTCSNTILITTSPVYVCHSWWLPGGQGGCLIHLCLLSPQHRAWHLKSTQ